MACRTGHGLVKLVHALFTTGYRDRLYRHHSGGTRANPHAHHHRALRHAERSCRLPAL